MGRKPHLCSSFRYLWGKYFQPRSRIGYRISVHKWRFLHRIKFRRPQNAKTKYFTHTALMTNGSAQVESEEFTSKSDVVSTISSG